MRVYQSLGGAMVLLALAVVGSVFAFQSSADKVTQIPVEVPKRTVEANPAKTRTYMKMKELGAQKILNGLVHRDFDQIHKGAESLKWISLDSPKHKSGDETDDKIYEHFRVDFARLAGKLEKMAEAKNLEGAAYTYQNLTSTCISCHEHLRDKDRQRRK